MSEKLPISVHILTFNSVDTVEKALKSAEGCAEILVIDGGSTDGTLEIAQKYGATVLPQRPESAQGKRIENFSAVRNIALQANSQPWVLALDSDEYLSQELLSELPKVVSGSPAAYFVPRKYVLADGRVVDYATTYPNKRLYLFHKDAVEQWIKPVHERPQVREGMPIKHLKGASLAPLSPMEEYKEKNLRYLQIEVKKSAGKGWGNWFVHRVLHTLRSRLIALVRLALIWLVPRKGVRLPLRQELIRFWYGWKLICATCPLCTKK